MKNKVITYMVMAYLISWTIAFVIYLLFKLGRLSEYQLNLFHALAALGPAIAAIISTQLFYGSQGVKKLASKIKFGKPDRNTVLLILSPIFFLIVGLLVYRLLKGNWYSFTFFYQTHLRSGSLLMVWLLPLITYPIFEEIGWRGFLLPHLQEKFSAWTSTIYLSVIWALWHFPFFFYRFDFSLGIAFGFFFSVFVGAIILTSIYNSSQGYLIPVILFHFFNNFCSEFDKEIIVAVLSVGFTFIAIHIFKKFGKEDLSQLKREKNYFEMKMITNHI